MAIGTPIGGVRHFRQTAWTVRWATVGKDRLAVLIGLTKWLLKTSWIRRRLREVRLLQGADRSVLVRQVDEGRISITPAISPIPYILKFGSFCVDIPTKEEVKPNFRTPPVLKCTPV